MQTVLHIGAVLSAIGTPLSKRRKNQVPPGPLSFPVDDVKEVGTAGWTHSFHIMPSRHYNISIG